MGISMASQNKKKQDEVKVQEHPTMVVSINRMHEKIPGAFYRAPGNTIMHDQGSYLAPAAD